MKHCHVAKSFWASVFFAIACLAIPGYSLAVDWALRMDGIGPLKIGMYFRSANRALGNVLKRTPPKLRASVNCDYVSVKGHPDLALMFVGDVLKRIDSSGPGIKTAAGVTVGDPVSKVYQLYPDIKVEPNDYEPTEQYLTSPSDGLAIRFETRDGTIARFYAGAVREVHFTERCL